MSELNYKELQEKGVFDVPYKAFQFMQHQQSKIDELTKQRDSFIKAYEIEIDKSVELQKRIDEYKKLTTSIRNEFDLWSDDSEFADVIEAQIENLEALRGASD